MKDMFVVDSLVLYSQPSLPEVVGQGSYPDEVLLFKGGQADWYFLHSRHRDNINTINCSIVYYMK